MLVALLAGTIPALLVGRGPAAVLTRANALRMDVVMPAVLAEWGCDEELWGKVRAKQALVKLVEDGDEAGARARLDMVRNGPPAQELTPILIEWGCDEDLWRETRSKGALLELAKAGDEAKGRERIALIRASMKMGSTPKASKASRPAADRSYKLKGTPPAGVDISAVEELLSRRMQAKKDKAYDTADALQAELKEMGVWVNDKARTWEEAKGQSGYSLRGAAPLLGACPFILFVHPLM